MLNIQNISYIHPDKEVLFRNISFSIKKQEKVALIGNNGTGKSTLLKIICGILKPSEGSVQCESVPYYIPQHFGQFDNCSVAEALYVKNKITALDAILNGDASETNLAILNDDWTIEERCLDALSYWGVKDISLTDQLCSLSGGEKTKVFLTGLLIHEPDIIVFDEPTNHLDTVSREMLYEYVRSCNSTLVVVTHDKVLLQLFTTICELDRNGIKTYGGDYDFYKEQKKIEIDAFFQQYENKEKVLKTAMKIKQEAMERKQRQDVRGKAKLQKENMPRIVRNSMRSKAEVTTAKLNKAHSEKISSLSDELKQMREKIPDIRKIKLDFDNSALHTGKVLVEAHNLNFKYKEMFLWEQPLNFQIRSGEKICIKGQNGSGKSTLVKLITGDLFPGSGALKLAEFKSLYIDQDYSLVNNNMTVYEHTLLYNVNNLQEHEIKIRLNRFLFEKDFWAKPCSTLSGGEKMRVMLCCLMISDNAPDLFILDEPTNNLDIQNIEILASAINEYKGTLIVISHDSSFLKDVNITRTIEVQKNSKLV